MREILAEWRALDTSRPALRKFGGTVGALLIALAVLVAARRGWTVPPLSRALGVGGALLVGVGTVLPGALRPLFRAWMLLAVVMGFVTTRVLLTAVFALVVTPLALLRRALGHDTMRRRRPDGSLWIARTPPEDPRRTMERTF